MVAAVAEPADVATRDPARYVRFAWLMAGRYAERHRRYTAEELVGPCMEGVIQACRSRAYDPARATFLTYVGWRVRAAVWRFVCRERRAGLTGFGPWERNPAAVGIRVGRLDPDVFDPPTSTADDDAGDAAQLLRRALAGLPPRERYAVESAAEGGPPLEDVARHLGVSKSRASGLRARGIARLRERFPAGADA